ncbi:MAG: glycosyltransferase family 2 protein [Candidatus Humimicrobiaceae bacterium]
MDLSIIIINYNSLEFLKSCLESLEKITGPVSWEALAVDNGSSDGSVSYLEKMTQKRKNFKFFNAGKNLGFSLASNLAANEAEGDFLLFLNPDTRMLDSNLGDMLDFYAGKAKEEQVGIIGAKLLNPGGSLQYSCRSFPTLARQFYESFFLYRIFRRSRIFGSYFLTWWDHESTRAVDWLSGAFMLVDRKTFKKVGGFDARFFMYSEDTDLALRLKREGFTNYYYPFFKVEHNDSGIASRNSPKKIAEIWKSRVIYFKKNYSIFHGFTVGLLMFSGIVNRIVIGCLLLKKKKVLDNIKAIPIYFK